MPFRGYANPMRGKSHRPLWLGHFDARQVSGLAGRLHSFLKGLRPFLGRS